MMILPGLRSGGVRVRRNGGFVSVGGGGGGGGGGVIIPPSAKWIRADMIARAAAEIPSFGSSAEDTTVTNTARGATVFVDPTLSNNNGSGAYGSAKQILTPASNTEFLIRNGTRFVFPAGSLMAGKTNYTIGTYDGQTGARIINPPKPRVRALAGQWLTDDELGQYFATIDTDWTAAANSNGPCAILASTAGGAVFRNLRFANWGSSCIQYGAGMTLRVEDCYFDFTRLDTRVTTLNHFAGIVFRCIDDNAGGNLVVARTWIYTNTEDIWWKQGTGQAAARASDVAILADSAVISTMDAQYYGNQHSDIIQILYTDGVQMRRNVIQHYQLHTQNLGTNPYQGKVIITGNHVDANNPCIMEDNIYCTNYDGLYIGGGPFIERRNGFILDTPAVTGGSNKYANLGSDQGNAGRCQSQNTRVYVKSGRANASLPTPTSQGLVWWTNMGGTTLQTFT